METPSQATGLAANIFQDMVMQEAIKDKTIQVKQQMKDEQDGTLVDLDKVDEHLAKKEEVRDSDEDLDEEEESIMRSLREKRLEEMKQQYKQTQEDMTKGHGQYQEIDESEFLPTVTNSKFAVCHFYHKDFERCKIVDMHLRTISKQHIEAKFVYLNAEKAPFFVQKLQIQVLPTLVIFIDGIAVDRVVGFEDLGNTDDFKTVLLSRRLIRSGVIKPKTQEEKGPKITKKGKRKNDSESDSGEDI